MIPSKTQHRRGRKESAAPLDGQHVHVRLIWCGWNMERIEGSGLAFVSGHLQTDIAHAFCAPSGDWRALFFGALAVLLTVELLPASLPLLLEADLNVDGATNRQVVGARFLVIVIIILQRIVVSSDGRSG